MLKKQLKFIVGVGIIITVMAWQVIVGFQQNRTYYITVAELTESPNYEDRLRVGGIVEPGSIERENGELKFRLTQEEAALSVLYVGDETPPDTFVDRAEGIVEGRYTREGVFHAEKIQARCTSKYEAGKYEVGNYETGKYETGKYQTGKPQSEPSTPNTDSTR